MGKGCLDGEERRGYLICVGTHVVYQVINHDRKETFFGITDAQLEQEVERLAKDPKGPAKDWKKGETVEWRPLTELMELRGARLVHRELESSQGREYTLLPTFVELTPEQVQP